MTAEDDEKIEGQTMHAHDHASLTTSPRPASTRHRHRHRPGDLNTWTWRRKQNLSYPSTHTPKKMKEEVSFSSSNASAVEGQTEDQTLARLSGDLYLPSSTTRQVPVIIVVAGSGPIDRDGNAKSMSFNTSNRFAEHVMRFLEPNVAPDSAGVYELVADVVGAVQFVSSHSRIDRKRVVILGHSEGAIILPEICKAVAESGLDPIFGAIFLAGFGEDLSGAMKLQRENILREVKEKTGLTGFLMRRFVTKDRLEKQYKDMMAKVNSDDRPDVISMYLGLVKQPARWFRDHQEYEARMSLANNIRCHVLAVTGKKDVQVRSFCQQEVAATLIPSAKSIEAHELENLTHVLRSMEGEPKIFSIKKDYVKMGKSPLDKDLLKIIDDWCDRVLQS
ncbi:hypothetical protein THAOC_30998 [Thalassiosira oceanica]|uniref:BD-FAE-like domain-containing protein n=1 Tax=Thalassiosira oceanica TaxID=159749 RepID=K0RCS7_THAOC|nr:hypothetical protein THAOC_30998 [Thalassiosira oceanica]|eukprot:EJK50069.1 hypothetical protein THAOC_30998 [Thalassiosira oceanica]